jgi:myo-inositol 2-dehydrogenase/D-chiro-inositol 1-dehydrogenase
MNVETKTDQKGVRVSVIGMGRIGILHLQTITTAPGVIPVIVSNPTLSKAQATASQYNVPRFFNDALDVINDPKADAIWICSPSQFHADQIKACTASKKHVFCKNPIASIVAFVFTSFLLQCWTKLICSILIHCCSVTIA